MIEVFTATTRDRQPVEVRLTDEPGIVVRVGERELRPRWGSQASDDWLDWIHAQREGREMTLPVDEPDFLRDEGYGADSTGW